MQQVSFSSNKPYLFRAILDWLLDNDATPYILVDSTKPSVDVPTEHIKDGQIVLNISPSAVENWLVDNHAISFSARFSGVARQIYVPMTALLAIYAQENGLGMAFSAEPADQADAEFGADDSTFDESSLDDCEIKKSTLDDSKIAKSDIDKQAIENMPGESTSEDRGVGVSTQQSKEKLKLAAATDLDSQSDKTVKLKDVDSKSKEKKTSHLKIVK